MDRVQIGPRSTADRSEIDTRSTADRHQIDTRSSQDREQIDPRSTRHRQQIDTRVDPGSTPGSTQVDPGSDPILRLGVLKFIRYIIVFAFWIRLYSAGRPDNSYPTGMANYGSLPQARICITWYNVRLESIGRFLRMRIHCTCVYELREYASQMPSLVRERVLSYPRKQRAIVFGRRMAMA